MIRQRLRIRYEVIFGYLLALGLSHILTAKLDGPLVMFIGWAMLTCGSVREIAR